MVNDDISLDEDTPEEIAVIGLAARFPGAKNIDQYWQNLRDGVESIMHFTDQELEAQGVPSEWLKDPNYVKAGTTLEDFDNFDAPFFGYSPLEAEKIDPQQRIFLETAWEALENAGYDPGSCDSPIGVFGGSNPNDYVELLPANVDCSDVAGAMEKMIGNEKDFLCTRVSYKLNLRGPSLTIQTGCSTSLVAVQLACQSLLNYQCSIALAGGVSINLRHSKGYFYQEGTIVSPDGHCRAFDASAQGTVLGQGVGVVVLKRLSEALSDGDTIHAVIKGVAINNDGALKTGYTAPGVDGQVEVIVMAQALSRISADTISYIEAHGTGTSLGDPIEIAALTQAFRASTQKKGFCAIGSVKTNIGHADAAAGIAGLIKTVLALKHKQLPPSLNFEKPNPEIDFENSPFYVNTGLVDWQVEGIPRRAGVSSFGIGGTNAHVVLEEAPEVQPSGSSRPQQLLLLSAKTETALDAMTQNLAAHLKQHPDINLADAAFTLQVGRKAWPYRRMLVCKDTRDTFAGLEPFDGSRAVSTFQQTVNREVVFMFPGQGAQYVNMGLELYQTEPAFKQAIDRCAEILKPHVKLDLREILYPANPDDTEAVGQQLTQTANTQPALFAVEYALAQLWMAWGVRPTAMVGHSIGEYVAACLAGVFTLDDALALVAARGYLIQDLPEGSMLAVQMSEEEIQPFTGNQLSLAAVNAPSFCVLSGKTEAIEKAEKRLLHQDVVCQRLHTSHAFHSKMMEPILEKFEAHVGQVELKPPQIPYVSNVTGTWITADETVEPGYWSRHLRRTVRFADCINTLLNESNRVLLEVGPGNTLCTLVRRSTEKAQGQLICSSIRHPKKNISDVPFILTSLGRLWLTGIQPDWGGFYEGERRHRVPLPTYPFERRRFWITPSKQIETRKNEPVLISMPEKSLLANKNELSNWFYVPSWRQVPISDPRSGETATRSGWLVFMDRLGLGARLAERLEQNGQEVIKVKVGEKFFKRNDRSYTLNPQIGRQYEALFNDLENRDKMPQTIIHLWSLTDAAYIDSGLRWLDKRQDLGFYSLLNMVQAIGKRGMYDKFRLEVITSNVHDVTGQEILHPEKATILGACKVIPLEYANIACRHIDVMASKKDSRSQNLLIDQLLAELAAETAEATVAFRGRHRWVPSFEPVRMDDAVDEKPTRLKDGGVYLITGGLGGIGFALAEDIAKTVRAKLILTGRSEFPPRDTWEQWLATHPDDDRTSMKIKNLLGIEELGCEVLVASADIADLNQMQQVIDRATRRFGPINGVIHAAGVIDEAGAIQLRTREMTEKGLGSKVRGTLVIDEMTKGDSLDFMLLCSSVASVFYHNRFGQVSYVAGNSFLDAFSAYKSAEFDTFTVTINWDDWQGIGMSAKAQKLFIEAFGRHGDLVDPLDQFTPAEGVILFRRILKSNFSRVVISTRDLESRLANDLFASSPFLEAASNADLPKLQHPRPNLSTEYVAPDNESESTIAGIWQEILGVENVGIHDDYFELGGDSLIAAQFISRLRERFQVEMPLQMIFETPTIKGMADKIETLLWTNQGTKDTFEQAGIDLVEGEI